MANNEKNLSIVVVLEIGPETDLLINFFVSRIKLADSALDILVLVFYIFNLASVERLSDLEHEVSGVFRSCTFLYLEESVHKLLCCQEPV